MRTIPLDAIPNQSLSVTLDGNRWDMVLKEANGIMCASLKLNDVLIVSGERLVAGFPFIPFKYLQESGNFWIITENDELPYYTQFGINQRLIYISHGEI